MHSAGHAFNLLSPAEEDLIYASALRILAEMGMEIQHPGLLQALAEAGLPVDFAAERVRFPTSTVERFLASAEKFDWAVPRRSVRASAGVYNGLYHDPQTNQLLPWTEENLVFYFALARALPQVGTASMLGCRLPVPGALEPLYERYYSWKYGAAEGGSIHLDELCPYLLEIYQARAQALGAPLEQVFHGSVYLVPALRLGRHEAHQVAYFRAHGLRVHIGGSMLSLGANAPASLAGGVTLNLAEQLALNLLGWALFGEQALHLHASIAVLDMRSTIRPFGRPEMVIANLMTAQLARRLGASFNGHAGLSDAKLPSVEAGAQKAISAVATLLAGGSLWIDAGLLGIDEICSPIQLVLDNEFASALQHFTKEIAITPESLGLDVILSAGPAGFYLDLPHTAQHFRREHWLPRLWSRQMLFAWQDSGARLDADLARQYILDLQSHPPEPPAFSAALEQDLLRVIASAGQALGLPQTATLQRRA
jgi:trimethylamine--corrinoid protein Co-methyltransferase